MATTKMYSIYDNKIDSFGVPFFCGEFQLLIRMMQRAVNDTALDVGMFPSDFTLFELGEFDTQTGEVTAHVSPTNIGLMAQFKMQVA